MPLTAADARRWLDGFEAAERADYDARRRQGPRPEWSIALALSLFEAARTAASGGQLVDPRRAQQDEDVRHTWHKLRSRLLS